MSVGDLRTIEQKNFRKPLSIRSLGAEFDADSEFHIRIGKKSKFGGEKSDLLCDVEVGLFLVMTTKPPSNALKKSEISLVMCRITFQTIPRQKKLIRAEFEIDFALNT